MTTSTRIKITDVTIRLSELYFPDDDTIEENDNEPSTSEDAVHFAAELEKTARHLRLLAADGFIPHEYEGIEMRAEDGRSYDSWQQLQAHLRGLGLDEDVTLSFAVNGKSAVNQLSDDVPYVINGSYEDMVAGTDEPDA